jgi:hypothetical protein
VRALACFAPCRAGAKSWPSASGGSSRTRRLRQPVERVRDARSLLMLKLLFLTRREADLAPLLTAQRERFAARSR